MNKFDSRDKIDTVSSCKPDVSVNDTSKSNLKFSLQVVRQMKHELAKNNSDLSLLLIPVLTPHVEIIFHKENCAETKSEQRGLKPF